MTATTLTRTAVPAERLRQAHVGEVLPASLLGHERVRRLEASALLVTGEGELDDYAASLERAAADFAAWDGRLAILPPDGRPAHRLVIVDRYGQVYETTDAEDATSLPDAEALTEWFKFLATACPECGVLDDPTERDWVP